MNNVRNLTLKPRVRGLFAILIAVAGLLASACREEGGGVIVRHLGFEGVRLVSEADLRLAVTTSGSSMLPWGQKTFFSKQEFDDDLKRLESFYVSRGFPDARVTSFRTTYNKTKSEMDLVVIIDEGAPVVLERIDFVGFDPLPQGHVQSLRDRAALVPGAPRDQERVEVVRGMALDELRDHGFPTASVSLAERPGTAPRSVIVTFTALPGPYATFGDVVISGNGGVKRDVIDRQLAFKKGEPFKLSALQVSQRRLYGLELFQFANVEVADGAAAASGQVPIKITVVEAEPRQFTFGVGYGSEDKARVEATWRHVNFLGGARSASLEGKYSSLERGVRASFSDPTVIGGASIGLNGQSWYSNTPAYTLRTTGGRLGVLRALSGADPIGGTRARDSISLSFAREYESYDVSETALADATFRPTLIGLGLNPETGHGSGTLAAVTLDVQRNTVANLLDARSGMLISGHAELAGKALGGDWSYRELSGEARVYVAPFQSLVVAVHARAGSLASAGDPETTVPFFKRYFLGGATSLRGWGRYEVAPLTPLGLPIGGFSMFESSGELRFTPGAIGDFGVVAFFDAGNVWNQSWKLRPADLRTDVGAGIRYRTPVGPLRLDVAYQLTPIDALVLKGGAAGDYRRWRFHFSIGQAF